MLDKYESRTPDETFAFGEQIAACLIAGDVILLYGGLGAGKTLLTKGIMNAIGYDIDEVTSPSFTLVNLYETEKFDVYHIDLWRLEAAANPAEAVGLSEILENDRAIAIIEWAERLGGFTHADGIIKVIIDGDGDLARQITVSRSSD